MEVNSCFCWYIDLLSSRRGVVGIATKTDLDYRGFRVGTRKCQESSPRGPDWPYGPPILLYKGFLELLNMG
jgi:hypothetical protein